MLKTSIKRWIVFGALVLSCSGASADDGRSPKFPVIADGVIRLDPKNPTDEQTLRSIVGDQRFEVMMKQAEKEKGYRVEVPAKQVIGQSTPGQIAALVREMRDNLCTALKKGDEFKFTMAWDASAKVWGIGVSGNSGIEVTIKCEKK